MTHDTADLRTDEWRSTIPPAEACTELGADAPQPAPADVRIGVVVVVVVLSIWCAGLWHLAARVLA